jgi:hypothetical protein
VCTLLKTPTLQHTAGEFDYTVLANAELTVDQHYCPKSGTTSYATKVISYWFLFNPASAMVQCIHIIVIIQHDFNA